MKNFTSINDCANPIGLVEKALLLKKNPYSDIGNKKTLGLVFFNPSLRTRLSTQKAAYNLGMNVLVMNINNDGWQLEMEDGAIMNQGSQEHIKDAIPVIASYCDIIGVRTFAGLKNQKEDEAEDVLELFKKLANIPVVSLESTTLHPLQSLADLITIKESGIQKPKVVVSWAPHPKALPHAVANSFLEWVTETDAEVVLTHPKGYELNEKFSKSAQVEYNQEKALQNADFVYAKSWCSSTNYGQHLEVKEDWIINQEKMNLTNNGKFMHCLPLRRNVIATDEVVDNSIVYQQARNRLWSAQAVLQEILQG